MPKKSDDPLHPWHPYEALYPMAMVRSSRLTVILLYATIALGFVAFVIGLQLTDDPSNYLHPITIALLMPLLAAAILSWIIATIMSRRARQADYARCLQCSRSLKGLKQHGNCPQCGTTYDLEQVTWAWKRATRETVPHIPPMGNEENATPSCTLDKRIALQTANPYRFGLGKLILPQACKRILTPWLLAWALTLLSLDIALIIIGSFIDLKVTLGMYWGVWEAYLYLGLFVIGPITAMFMMHRWKKRSRELNGCLCLDCGQSLQGHEAIGQCPECGTAYNVEANCSIWAAFRHTARPWFLQKMKRVN